MVSTSTFIFVCAQIPSSICVVHPFTVCTVWKHIKTCGKYRQRFSTADCFIYDLYSIKVCFFHLQMSNTGNWMHVQYQSKLQARKALSKDGKIFGEAIMIGVKPCIDKVRSTAAIILLVVIVTVVMLHCECLILSVICLQSVMESSDKSSTSSSVFTPPVKAPGTPSHPLSTPRSVMRPLSAAYKASSSDYQV